TYTNSDVEKITPTSPSRSTATPAATINSLPSTQTVSESNANSGSKSQSQFVEAQSETEPFEYAPFITPSVVKFDGKASFSTKDRDKDGLIEVLQARVPIRITENVPVVAIGVLKKNGEIIASRPNWNSSALSQVQLSGDRIKQTIKLDFSGEEIYRGKKNGPFDLEIYVTAGDSTTSNSFATRSYKFERFGEVGLHIAGLSEQPRFVTNQLNNTQYVDSIDIVIQLDIRRHGMFFLAGELEKSRSRVSLGELQLSETGYHSVRLPVPLSALKDAGLDGPYDVNIRVTEKRTMAVAEDQFTTRPYQHRYFN
ncbi:MAG: hypothetical protein HKM24_02790, partial [Gammaproteobacteria bacterium]|nr:hypothetical protein [Gammaproteobacteria bacterium]